MGRTRVAWVWVKCWAERWLCVWVGLFCNPQWLPSAWSKNNSSFRTCQNVCRSTIKIKVLPLFWSESIFQQLEHFHFVWLTFKNKHIPQDIRCHTQIFPPGRGNRTLNRTIQNNRFYSQFAIGIFRRAGEYSGATLMLYSKYIPIGHFEYRYELLSKWREKKYISLCNQGFKD